MANRNEGHAQPKSPSASDPVEARKIAAETARVRHGARAGGNDDATAFVILRRDFAQHGWRDRAVDASGRDPAGVAAEPHLHRGLRAAIYLLEGRVETRYGPGLAQSVFNQAGDFIFIPANLPHQPINLSTTDPARAIVARNDPNEQESVALYEARPGA